MWLILKKRVKVEASSKIFFCLRLIFSILFQMWDFVQFAVYRTNRFQLALMKRKWKASACCPLAPPVLLFPTCLCVLTHQLEFLWFSWGSILNDILPLVTAFSGRMSKCLLYICTDGLNLSSQRREADLLLYTWSGDSSPANTLCDISWGFKLWEVSLSMKLI